ncbi:MAG: ParB/RepB/Spo0J family partition protein [Patescibacteria group bacterium]|jgi:ParB family chromosome partitioning protein
MALGRGLSSLIPSIDKRVAQAAVAQVSVDDIVPNPHQPRRHFSHQELEELVQSIKQHGILQPLLVSPAARGYELIAGERRLRSAKIAGLETVPVIVRQVDELEKIELALIENIQRSDLSPIEKAEGYRKLLQEFGLNHDEAAKKLGLSRSSFSNTLRLLDLPGDIQKALAEGKITEGHAKVLLGLDNERDQRRYVELIKTDHLSVQKLTTAVSGVTKQRHSLPSGVFSEELATALGTKVKITPTQIIIEYYSPAELNTIIKKITRNS